MSLFRKIFGFKDKPEDQIKDEERGKYMPEIKLPIDEQFTINFKANGGKFLYCENMQEILNSLDSILKENNWKDSKVLLYDDRLKKMFKNFKLNAKTCCSGGSLKISLPQFTSSKK